MSCVSPPRSLASSTSDYGTCGSACCSDDDQPAHLPGICPYCKHPYISPLTLQCGHSLCSSCVTELLAVTNSSPPYRRGIRMGLRSYNLQKNCSSPVVYRSPACIVCHEPPKFLSPVPNLELQLVLRSFVDHREHPAFREAVPEIKDESFFHQCKVAILGGKAVGKSSLKRVQYGNDIVFKDILGINKGSDYLMIEMVDGEQAETDVDTADGFVLIYSITDYKSFLAVQSIFSLLAARRGPSTPVVLVASKADLWNERSVSAYKGQSLARQYGCPFLEVSAKKNDCVNEAFKELARLIEIQRLQQSVV